MRKNAKSEKIKSYVSLTVIFLGGQTIRYKIFSHVYQTQEKGTRSVSQTEWLQFKSEVEFSHFFLGGEIKNA